MAADTSLQSEHMDRPASPSSRSSSLELEVFPTRPASDAKGKGRYVADGQDTVEEDTEDTSDAEVEGLLHKGKVNVEDGSIEKEPAEPRRPKLLGGGRSSPAKTWMGRIFGDMSKAQGRLFVREMLTEMLPILLLALMGAIVTGMLLVKLQGWRVFIRIEELFILVPILLNLKGNLEMNLAARFSTSANIGELDLRLTRRSLILGNLALLQVQALIVSLISGLLAFILGLLSRRGVHHALQNPVYNPNNGGVSESLRGGYFEALLVLCVSMLAASISSGVLGSFMCSLVVMCRRFKINPDNIATPLASALGDMVTLVILGVLSSIFAKFMGTLVSTAVFLLLLGAVGVNVVITFRNAYVQELLTIGWGPLFIAMAISSGSGLVLEAYVNEYEGFGLFAPVVTAISGAAGSIYVSRISTSLHSSSKEHYLIVALSLFALTCPVLFLFFLFVWATGQAPVTLLFAVGFVVVVCLQVALSLTLAYHLAFILWRMDYDPDVYALPLLSSFLDVSGQLLLVGAFALGKKAVAAVAGVNEGVVEVGADALGLR